MIAKEAFRKATRVICDENARQSQLWDKLDGNYINVDKLVQEVNVAPMIDLLAMICDCPFNVIADCVGSYDEGLVDELYEFLCDCDENL